MDALKIVALMNFSKFADDSRKYPEASLYPAKTSHGNRFDFSRLRSELAVVCSNEKFSGKKKQFL